MASRASDAANPKVMVEKTKMAILMRGTRRRSPGQRWVKVSLDVMGLSWTRRVEVYVWRVRQVKVIKSRKMRKLYWVFWIARGRWILWDMWMIRGVNSKKWWMMNAGWGCCDFLHTYHAFKPREIARYCLPALLTLSHMLSSGYLHCGLSFV